jgi:hypothetical protein
MIAAVGQLATQAAQEIIKRIFKGPDSGISGRDITIVRQVIIGGTGEVRIGRPSAVVNDNEEMMRLVAQRCIELLAALDGVEITLAVAPDGTRTLSVRRTSGSVREDALLRALGQAGGAPGPRHFVVPVTAPVAASSLARGHLELFVLTSGSRLRHRWYWPEPNWSAWHDMSLPAESATAIAAGSKGEHHQEVAVAIGRTVHHRWWTGKEHSSSDWGWSSWHAMPSLPTPVTDLAFSSNIADAMEIYALDEQGCIWHRWWWRDGGWSNGWTSMGTPGNRPVTAIAAGSYTDYHQELFAIVDGEIWHRRWWRNDGWSGWQQQAPVGMRAIDMAVSTLNEGHIEVFALDDGGRIRHRWYWAGRGWSDWEDFSRPQGSRLTAITAASNGPRHQEIYGLKESGKVANTWNHLHNDGKPDWDSWSEWAKWHYTHRVG